MKLLLNYFICFAFLNIALLTGQTPKVDYNLDFEIINPKNSLPVWIWPGGGNYECKIDSVIKQHGKYSISIESLKDTSSTGDYGNFGVFTSFIPSQFVGSEIILRGWLKTENVSVWAGLWLRIDGESGPIAFDNMYSRKISGTNEWKEYSIKLPFSDSAKKIAFGGLMSAKGKIWVDNLEILIDSVDITKAKVKTYKADLDSEFINGSKIEKIYSDKNSINNLYIFGLVWGYLKYYHPEIAKGYFNWDFELFRILPKILKCQDKTGRSKIILDWINKLGNIEPCEKCMDLDTTNTKIVPDLGWIEDSSYFNKDLIQKLIFIKNNRNQGKHYYFDFVPSVRNVEFQNENVYKDMNYSDAGFRLLALYRYWNMIQYFFPYKYAIGEDWKNVLKEFLPKFIEANDELSYRLTALELIGRVHDTHANIWGKDSVISEFIGNLYSTVEIKFIENKVVVNGFFDDSSGKLTNLNKGDIILSIDDEKVEDKIKRMLPYSPASNYTTQLRVIALDLLRSNKDKIKVEFLRNGKTFNTFIELYTIEKSQVYKRYMKKDTCFKFLSSDIGYINPGTIKSAYLSAIMEAVKNTKGLIIDFRCYPSEFIVFTLANYLLPKPTEFVKFTNTSVQYPGLFKFTSPLMNGTDNSEYYKGKVVILINETTISSAEYTTMALRNAPNAVVIGSTTAGADGNVSSIYLPGNIYTMISGIGVYYPDGRETQRIGIVPDIEVHPTIKGIQEGRDEVLEKALEIINKN